MFSLVVIVIFAQISKGIPKYSNLCACDLISDQCDVECCCDPLCSDTHRLFFESCHEKNSDYFGSCWVQNISNGVPSDDLILKLTPGCIYSYSDESQISFIDEISADLGSQLIDYASEVLDNNPTETVPSEYYEIGTPIYIQYFDNTTSPLLFETRSLDSRCTALVPITFLKAVHSKCSRAVSRTPVTDVSSFTIACDQLPGVPGLTGSSGTVGEFVVHTVPPFVNGTARQNQTVPIVRCWDASTWENITCPKNPPVPGIGDAWCMSVPTRLTYTIYYEATGQITALYIDAELGTVSQTFTQETVIKFFQTGQSLDEPASGNPGYRIGSVVIAARANRTKLSGTDSVTVMELTESVETVLGSPKNGRQRNLGGMWNLPTGGPCLPDTTGSSWGWLYEPLRFGQDTFTGCTLNLSIADFQEPVSRVTDWTARCGFYQLRLWHALANPVSTSAGPGPMRFVGPLPDHLASWPAAKTNQSGDWVPIQNPLFTSGPAKPTGRTGLCAGMLLGLDTEIQTAKFGSLANPQYRIVGARTNPVYGDLLIGPRHSLVEVTIRVHFLDVSPKAVMFQKERPLLLTRLPSDFFYPFL